MKAILVVLILAALAAAGGTWYYLNRAEIETTPEEVALDLADEMGTRSVTLYFGNAEGDALLSESRTIQARRYRDEEVEAVVAELVQGPQSRGAVRTLPPDTQLRGAFYDEGQRLLYLDFNQSLVADEMGGSAMEFMTLAAILRTIAVDFPEVLSVQFLVDGLEVETMGGHLDLTRPLRPEEWL